MLKLQVKHRYININHKLSGATLSNLKFPEEAIANNRIIFREENKAQVRPGAALGVPIFAADEG